MSRPAFHATRPSIVHPISPRQDDYLRVLAQYPPFLTAKQICRLTHRPGSLTTVQARLKLLADAEFLRVEPCPRNLPYGGILLAYALARPGERYLEELGIDGPERLHHAPGVLSHAFTDHTVEVNDFLIAAELLCRAVPRIRVEALLTSRTLTKNHFVLEVEHGRRVGVIPDAWIDFRHGEYQTCVSLELDRGTEEQKHWRRRVQAMVAWVKRSYKEQFGTTALTIAVVVTTGKERQTKEKRAADILRWTERELERLSAQRYAPLFRVTSAIPEEVAPGDLFLARIYRSPFADRDFPLIEDS